MAAGCARDQNKSRTLVKAPARPVSGLRRSTRGRRDVLFQSGHELDQVAGPMPVVELRPDHLPAVAASAGRTWQREQIRPAGDAGSGAALDGRGADLLIAEPAEQLAEAKDLFLVDRLECFRR